MDRLHVPSKNDIEAINRKLDKILKLLGDADKTAKPKAPRKTAKKKTSKKVSKKTN